MTTRTHVHSGEETMTVARAVVTLGLFAALGASVAQAAFDKLSEVADGACKAERALVTYGAVAHAPRPALLMGR